MYSNNSLLVTNNFFIKKKYPILQTQEEIINYLNTYTHCRLDFILHLLKYSKELCISIMPFILSKCSKNSYVSILNELDNVSRETLFFCIKNSYPDNIFEIIRLIYNPDNQIIEYAFHNANSDNIKKIIILLSDNLDISLIKLGMLKMKDRHRTETILTLNNIPELLDYFIEISDILYIETLVNNKIIFSYKNLFTLISKFLNRCDDKLLKLLCILKKNQVDLPLNNILLDMLLIKIPEQYIPELIVLYNNPTNIMLDHAIEIFKKNNIFMMEGKNYYNYIHNSEILEKILKLYKNPSEQLIKTTIRYFEYDKYTNLFYSLITLIKNPSDEFLEEIILLFKNNIYDVLRMIKNPSKNTLKYALENIHDRIELECIITQYKLDRDFIILTFYNSSSQCTIKLFSLITNLNIELLSIALNKCNSEYINIIRIFILYKELKLENDINDIEIKKYNFLIEKYLYKYLGNNIEILNNLIKLYIGDYSKEIISFYKKTSKNYLNPYNTPLIQF